MGIQEHWTFEHLEICHNAVNHVLGHNNPPTGASSLEHVLQLFHLIQCTDIQKQSVPSWWGNHTSDTPATTCRCQV